MNSKSRMILGAALFLFVLPAMAVAQITDRAEVFYGQVAVTLAGESDVVVMMDHLPKGGDGVADEAFIFRSTTALPADLKELHASARIVVRSDSLFIHPKGDRPLLLALSAGEEGGLSHFVASKRSDSLFVDAGYQITRLYGSSGDTLHQRAMSQLGPDDPFSPPFQLKDGCYAGGPGSDECSVSGNAGPVGGGCSVSCTNGYYACCGVSGCFCEPSGPQPV